MFRAGLLALLTFAVVPGCNSRSKVEDERPPTDTSAAAADAKVGARDNGAALDQATPPDTAGLPPGPLSIRLTEVAITIGGYQGSNNVFLQRERTMTSDYDKLWKKGCKAKVDPAVYDALVKLVISTGFMKAAKEHNSCVTDTGYRKLTVWVHGDGGVQTATYQGQGCKCGCSDAEKKVLEAWQQLMVKTLMNSKCSKYQ